MRFKASSPRLDITGCGEDADDIAGFIPINRGVVQHRHDAAVLVTEFQLIITHKPFEENLLIAYTGLLVRPASVNCSKSTGFRM